MIPTETGGPVSLPSISVAMATFQGEKYLLQQLESIARQTLQPLEVVITDDRSSDATGDVVAEFARNAPFPVRFSRNETRLKYAENFLRAASLCKGDLIAFCDQDDLWLEHKLSTCAAYFRDPKVQLVCHTAQTLFSGGELRYLFPHFSRTRKLPRGQCDPLENRPGFAMLIRRQLLSVVSPEKRPDRLRAHDHFVWFMAAVTGTVVKLSDVLCHYRQHENNVFGATDLAAMGRKLKVATETPGYLKVAANEADCSRFLLDCMDEVPIDLKHSVDLEARKLAYRSLLHRKRYGMYADDFSVFSRARAYLAILLAGGYFPDLSKTKLGPKAALKDLIWGVAGGRHLFS